MKKNYFKIFLLGIFYFFLFISALLVIKHFILNPGQVQESQEKGKMLSAQLLTEEKIFWEQIQEEIKETRRIFQDILANPPPEKQFSFLTSGTSMRYFVGNSPQIAPMGIFISDGKTKKNEISAIIKDFPRIQFHLAGLKKHIFAGFFISKENWIALSPGNWISEIEDGHDLKKDIFYHAWADPEDPAGSAFLTELYYDDIWSQWMVAILLPVYVNGEFRGVVGHGIRIEALYSLPVNRKLFEKGNWFALNHNFDFLLHRDLKPFFQRNDFEMNQRFNFPDEVKDSKAKIIADKLKEKFFEVKSLDIEEKTHFAFVHRIPGFNWYRVYTVDQKALNGLRLNRERWFVFSFLAVFLLFTCLLFWFFRRAFITPIRAISQNLRQFHSTGIEQILKKKKTLFPPLIELFVGIENVFTQISSNMKGVGESRDYIETVMKTVQVFIVVLNAKLKPIYLNDYALKKLNIRKEEISSLRIFHYVDKSFFRELARELQCAENVLNRETPMILQGGRMIEANISVSKMRNLSQELSGYIAVVEDITKRRKIEMNLKNQIAFSRQIFKSIPDMIFIVDTKLKIVFYNEKGSKIIEQFPQTEKHISFYLSEKSLENGFDESLKNMINKGDYIKHINVLNPFREGSNYVDLIIEPLKSTSGIIGGLIIMRDITEWRSLTEKIKNLQEYLSRLIDASPFAMISIKENDHITLWNQAAESLFQIPSHKALDRNLFEISPFFLSYRDIINEVKILEKIFSLSDQKMDFERESPVVLNLNFYPVQSEGRNVVINIEDMSKIKKLEDSLMQSQKMESLGLLTSGIIHDFNNILSGIIGYASILDKKVPADSEIKKYSSNIMDYSEKASAMVKQILGFSKKKLSKKEVLDLNMVIEELLNFLKVNLKNIKIVRQLSPDKIRLFVDKTKISQVIINLIINAKEALEKCDQPTITVSTEEVSIRDREDLLDGSYAQITISDNGSGIKKEHLDKIFEPFFSTKNKEKSTGLGLAMVKDITKDFNGAIDVESEYEKGTSFSILIPVVKEELYKTQDEIKKKVEAAIEGAILLVDDELVIREIGGEMLNSLGITCFTASNGDEAIQKFIENKKEIKLVILDIEMPGLSGDQVAEKLQKITPELKILFSSGYTRDYLESKVFKDKIKNFIPKPFHLDQLADKLNKLMRT